MSASPIFPAYKELPGVDAATVPNVQFANLTHGSCAYRVWGPSDASKRLLFVHGLSTFSFLYHPLAQKLSTTYGCKIVTYDLFSRGMSLLNEQHASDAHDMSLFVTQLSELVDIVYPAAEEKNDGSKRFDVLVGLSMGGPISAEYGRLNGKNFSKLVMLAPAGLPVQLESTAKLISDEAAWFANGRDSLKAGAARDWPEATRDQFQEEIKVLQENVEWTYANNFQWLGGILSSLRNFPISTAHSTFEGVGNNEEPQEVTVVWGDEDAVCPYRNSVTLKELIPRIKLVTLPGCGHMVPINELQGLYDVLEKTIQ
jgi:pimeloyl-ACP methyl ester carboxylesterase